MHPRGHLFLEAVILCRQKQLHVQIAVVVRMDEIKSALRIADVAEGHLQTVSVKTLFVDRGNIFSAFINSQRRRRCCVFVIVQGAENRLVAVTVQIGHFQEGIIDLRHFCKAVAVHVIDREHVVAADVDTDAGLV